MNDTQDRLNLTNFARMQLREIDDFLHEMTQCAANDAACVDKSRPRLIAILEDLRTTLARQFVAEVADGPLEEAACQCPHLNSEVHNLVAEHPQLLASIDLALEHLRRSPGIPHSFVLWAKVFARRLLAHESQKSKVLMQGLGLNLAD